MKVSKGNELNIWALAAGVGFFYLPRTLIFVNFVVFLFPSGSIKENEGEMLNTFGFRSPGRSQSFLVGSAIKILTSRQTIGCFRRSRDTCSEATTHIFSCC